MNQRMATSTRKRGRLADKKEIGALIRAKGTGWDWKSKGKDTFIIRAIFCSERGQGLVGIVRI